MAKVQKAKEGKVQEPETLAQVAKEQNSLHKKGINEIRALVASRYGDYDDKANKEELIAQLEK